MSERTGQNYKGMAWENNKLHVLEWLHTSPDLTDHKCPGKTLWKCLNIADYQHSPVTLGEMETNFCQRM